MFIFRLMSFALSFAVSYFILSIPVNNRTLFSHIDEWVSPAREQVLETTKSYVKKGVEQGREFGKKLFSNAQPELHLDKIKSRKSAIKKSNSPLSKLIKREELDKIEDDDIKKLNKFLRSN